MHRSLFGTLLLCVVVIHAVAQHTFSIVAIDPATGDMGSAGATCLGGPRGSDGAYVIVDVVKGKGAINTQSFYSPANQQRANDLLRDGQDAAAIIDWLSLPTNDVSGDPSVRQYGAVTIADDGSITAASFTGDNCFSYAGHLIGGNYAIQGNILLGREILDSMEARFLRAEGQDLGHRLMEAMQGANVPGADVRCLSDGVSSLSAYLTVYNAIDNSAGPSLEVIVPQTAVRVDPIDRLQELYDLQVNTEMAPSAATFTVYPNPATEIIFLDMEDDITNMEVLDVHGQVVVSRITSNNSVDVSQLAAGYYVVRVESGEQVMVQGFIKN